MSVQKTNKKQTWKKTIPFILMLIIIISGVGALKENLDNKRAQEEYERLAQLARQTSEAVVIPGTTQAETEPEPETKAAETIDFDALSLINPDVIGWIKIPDTNIDYPIVQTTDNDKYLSTSFEGEKTVAGSIYLDFESDSDMRGRNNILYGHNMKNGSMFKDVVKYKDKDYFKAHQYFSIDTPEGEIRLKAISCYYEKAEPLARKTRFKTRESFDAFVNAMLIPCSFAEIPEGPIDSLYTLITCSYEVNDARTFLFAVPVDEDGNVIPADLKADWGAETSEPALPEKDV